MSGKIVRDGNSFNRVVSRIIFRFSLSDNKFEITKSASVKDKPEILGDVFQWSSDKNKQFNIEEWLTGLKKPILKHLTPSLSEKILP